MEPVGFWEWMGLLLLFLIPGVNLIAAIVGAFGVGKRSFVNYSRALLVYSLIIGTTIGIIIFTQG